MSADYTMPAGFPEATVYAKLMDKGIEEPLDSWVVAVTARINEICKTLDSVGLEHLRRAYAAGVADGYRQALMELERGEIS